MLDIRDTALPEVKLIAPRRFDDARGTFCETWSRAAWRAAGIDADFVQDNQSLSRAAGTIRGLHFQVAPDVAVLSDRDRLHPPLAAMP